MSETLSTVIQNAAFKLGQVEEFLATGGSATTTVNSDWANQDDPPEEERFKNHYVIVKKTTDGLSPQGRWAKISAYAASMWTLTHATVTDVVGAGDICFFVNTSIFPFLEYITAVNSALKKIGPLSHVETTLTSTANQTEYSLPSGIIKLLDVQRQGITTDANDNRYFPVTGWRVYPPTTTYGTRPILYLPQDAAGYTYKLIYDGYHPEVSVYSDPINEKITPSLIYSLTKYYVLDNFVNKNAGSVDKFWLAERDRAAQESGVEPGPEKTLLRHRGMRWQDTAEEEDTFTWPD